MGSANGVDHSQHTAVQQYRERVDLPALRCRVERGGAVAVLGVDRHAAIEQPHQAAHIAVDRRVMQRRRLRSLPRTLRERGAPARRWLAHRLAQEGGDSGPLALGRILAIAAIYNAVRQWQSGRLHTRPVSPQVAPISPHRRRRVDSRDSAARTP